MAVVALALGVAPTLSSQAADGPYAVSFEALVPEPTLLIGGTGNFGFTSNACAQVDSDDALATGLCTITALGTFNNTICGTSTMDGTASIAPDPSDGGTETINFHVQLVAGIGTVTGNADGVMVAVLNSPQLLPYCTSGWTVVGAAVVP